MIKIYLLVVNDQKKSFEISSIKVCHHEHFDTHIVDLENL